MSDVESGGKGPINETSNEKCSSNEGHNNISNCCRPDSSGNRYITEKFKGKVEVLSTLGVKYDKRTYSFVVFQK